MIQKIKNIKKIDEIYCFILCLVSILSWTFSSMAGMIIILLIASLSLLIFNEFKYMIPCVFSFLYINNTGFDASKFPVSLIICGILFIIVLVFQLIRSGLHFKKLKSCKGIFLLAISCLIPILWHNVIPTGKEVLYFMYFAYILYLLVYFIFSISLDKNSLNMLISAMTFIGVLLASECMIKVFQMHIAEPDKNILDFWYYLGWGLCNEAGIMMCVSIPFCFIQLISSKTIHTKIISLLKIILIMIGMLLTGSRGTVVFGYPMVALLFFIAFIKSKHKVKYLLVAIVASSLLLIVIQNKIGINHLIHSISNNLFQNGLDDNGRKNLWQEAINLWNTSALSKTLGMGMVSKFYFSTSFNGYEEIYMVFHSTFFQTLAAFGIIGCVFLAIHLFEKYKQLLKFDKTIFAILFVGYIIVDLYGLIDNTYSMYYYMIPLMITMACFDNLTKEDVALQIDTLAI